MFHLPQGEPGSAHRNSVVTIRYHLQCYVSGDTAARVRNAAASDHLKVSQWLRRLVLEACSDTGSDGAAPPLERIEHDLTFTAVALDALLANNPDPDLRDRTHRAFARKWKRLSTSKPSFRSDNHEA